MKKLLFELHTNEEYDLSTKVISVYIDDDNIFISADTSPIQYMTGSLREQWYFLNGYIQSLNDVDAITSEEYWRVMDILSQLPH